MQNSSLRNFLPGQPYLFSADNNTSSVEAPLQRDRYRSNVYDLPIPSYNEVQGNNGIRSCIQDETIDPKFSQPNQATHEMDQSHEQDMEIGYEESPPPPTYEGLEQRFIDEIMKLARERSDAEDAEFSWHKRILEINKEVQEKLSALRALQVTRREEFLCKELQSRLNLYNESKRNYSPNMKVPPDPHGYSSSSTFTAGEASSSSTALPSATDSMPSVGNLSSTTAFGSSTAAVGSTGCSFFGFSSSSMKTLDSQSQGSIIGANASSGSVFGAQLLPATSGFGAQLVPATSRFAASTQSQSVSFGLFASSPSFGLAGSTGFSSGSSLFSSSSPATKTAFSSGSSFGSFASSQSFGLSGSTASLVGSLFTSSSPATNTAFSSGSSLFASSSPATSIFNSGPTFGVGTFASTSAANPLSSSCGTSATLVGSSSWQPSKSSFGSSSSASGFSFGASIARAASISSPFGTSTASVATASSPSMFLSTNSASTPQFSFSPAAATTSAQPAFGSPSPVFNLSSSPVNNNDQMTMEDSMAEDTIQATPVFGQQPAPVQSNFIFGAPAPSGASPFHLGSQQNVAPQNSSPFQASGGLEFNAGGGSFSLGKGGGDKAGRKFLRVKHKPRKK